MMHASSKSKIEAFSQVRSDRPTCLLFMRSLANSCLSARIGLSLAFTNKFPSHISNSSWRGRNSTPSLFPRRRASCSTSPRLISPKWLKISSSVKTPGLTKISRTHWNGEWSIIRRGGTKRAVQVMRKRNQGLFVSLFSSDLLIIFHFYHISEYLLNLAPFLIIIELAIIW